MNLNLGNTVPLEHDLMDFKFLRFIGFISVQENQIFFVLSLYHWVLFNICIFYCRLCICICVLVISFIHINHFGWSHIYSNVAVSQSFHSFSRLYSLIIPSILNRIIKKNAKDDIEKLLYHQIFE